jgi:cold shock CspA family protein
MHELLRGSLASLVDAFVEALTTSGLRKETVARYRSALDEFVEFAAGREADRVDGACQPELIEAFIASSVVPGPSVRSRAKAAALARFLAWLVVQYGNDGEPRSDLAAIAGRLRKTRVRHGTSVRRVIADRGFGYIEADREDYFFHRDGLETDIHFDHLARGDGVAFDFERGRRNARRPAVAGGTGIEARDTVGPGRVRPRPRSPSRTRVGAPVVVPPAPPDSIVQSRILEGKTTSHVARGDRLTVDVRVALKHHGLQDVDLAPIRVPAAGIRLRLVVSAPGFETLSEPSIPVVVPQAEDSAWLTFELRAASLGAHQVSVLAFGAPPTLAP